MSVLVEVAVAVMKHHDPKQVGEDRVYSAYISITEGSQDRNIEAEADAEAVDRCC